MERNFDLNYDSPTEIKILLEMMGLGPRKRWGQNFLINPGARKRILDQLQMQKGHKIWEIGPGLGAMTKDILEQGIDLTAFEIDPGYCEYLGMAFENKPLKLVFGDVLKTWEDQWDQFGPPNGLLGNLPYNAASAIIADLMEKRKIPERMVFLVQDEMGQRMAASLGTKNYSSFSVLCQYGCQIINAGKLNANSFYPAPRVSSRIVVMVPKTPKVIAKDWPLFLKLIRGLFSSRRKTLKNNMQAFAPRELSSLGSDDIKDLFLKEGIDWTLRPERLSVEQFVSLSNGLSDLVKEGHS